MPQSYRFGRIGVHAATRQVFVDGKESALGARAFDLLLALIERRERLVTKHELLDIVWPGLVVEENNLQVQVSALRRLLGPTAIATIPGRGYRFAAALDGAGDAQAGPAAGPTEAAPAISAVVAAGTAAGMDPTAAATTAAAIGPQPLRPLPGNLPAHLAILFGREAELHALLAQIEARSLVTIAGASGMGKTALALAAAHALRERWRDGVWIVELAPVSEPAQLVPALAQALRITLPAGGAEDAAAAHLVGVLGSMTMLLVLDNCEHLIDAAGALAERIGTHAPGVRLLATSQELLNIPGEALFKLNPLALPAPQDTLADATRFGSIRLFVERARSADARFELSRENVQAVADICRQLDGLPLAIELAAARVRLLGVHGLRERLDERFRILTSGPRTAMRRHQTLHAAIDWSHALLSSDEQTVLRRLGVFVGGFSLELAQQVARDEQRDEWAVLDALSGLVDKSLVVADAAEPPRYRLLETTRAYALQRLAEAGESQVWIERHARAVCDLFERTELARLHDQGTLSNVEFVRRLAPELDNARAALDWAGSESGELNLAVGLAGAATAIYVNLALSAEAAARLRSLRDRVDDSVDPARAALFWSQGGLFGGDLPLAVALEAAGRAERYYRASAEPRRLFQSLCSRAWKLTEAGEWRLAQELLPEIRSLQSPAWPSWLIVDRLRVEGRIHEAQGQFDQALATYGQQRALLQASRGERRSLINSESHLCRVLHLSGRDTECIELARMVIAREGGEFSNNMPFIFMRLMAAQVFCGQIEDARQTMHQALPGWRRNGDVFSAAGVLAVLLAALGRWADAARVGAAGSAFQRRTDSQRNPGFQRTNARLQQLLATAPCRPEEIERWQREGESLDQGGIAETCLRGEEGPLGTQPAPADAGIAHAVRTPV